MIDTATNRLVMSFRGGGNGCLPSHCKGGGVNDQRVFVNSSAPGKHGGPDHYRDHGATPARVEHTACVSVGGNTSRYACKSSIHNNVFKIQHNHRGCARDISHTKLRKSIQNIIGRHRMGRVARYIIPCKGVAA